MSGTETPDEITVDPAERGGAAWLATCIAQLGEDEGYQHCMKFIRRYKKKGGDMDALAADLKGTFAGSGEDIED